MVSSKVIRDAHGEAYACADTNKRIRSEESLCPKHNMLAGTEPSGKDALTEAEQQEETEKPGVSDGQSNVAVREDVANEQSETAMDRARPTMKVRTMLILSMPTLASGCQNQALSFPHIPLPSWRRR